MATIIEYKANDGSVWSTEREAMLRNTAQDGNSAFDRGDYDGAIAIFTVAIDADVRAARRDNMFCYAKRGEAYKEKGCWDLAIADFTVAIGDDNCDSEKLAGRYFNRANIYLKKNDYTNAMSDFGTVISIGYYIGAAYNGRGICYVETGKEDMAVVNYKIAADYGEKAALENLQKRGINYLPLTLNLDNSRHYSAAEKLHNAGDNDGAVTALNLVGFPLEQTDAKTAAVRGESLFNVGILYVKCGSKEDGIRNIKYSANYNNKDAKQYLKDNRIKHKRLLWEPNRNGFVSFIFGLVGGGGVLLSLAWFSLLRDPDALSFGGFSGLLGVLGYLLVFAVSAIITGWAWSYKKDKIFAVMCLIFVTGWLSAFGVLPNSIHSIFAAEMEAKREADRRAMVGVTVTVAKDANLHTSDDTKSRVERVIKKGESVEIDRVNHESGWTRVLHNNYYGYVRTEFLNIPAVSE